MLARELPRGSMKLPRAPVVAEPLPMPEHDLLVGVGQRLDVGESPQEPLEIRDDGRHLRLLEHDLADPNGVRVASSPPRQIARVAAKPSSEQPREAPPPR